MEIELELGGVELEIEGWRGLFTLAALVVLGAALAQQLCRPAAERTWHGRVFGAVPYDFRVPTVEQLRAAYWDPSNPRLFTDRPLGVGWAINLARLLAPFRAATRA
jgi:hypothetical protein